MAIRTRTAKQREKALRLGDGYVRLRRKADQEWEMAGLARTDGDTVAEKAHTAKARAWEAHIREVFPGE